MKFFWSTSPFFIFVLANTVLAAYVQNLPGAALNVKDPVRHDVRRRQEGKGNETAAEELPFTYGGITGPLNWANLNVNNSLCSTGKTQSPTNIDTVETDWSPLTQVNLIDDIKRTITYDGLTIELEEESEDLRTQAMFDGELYTLRQWHHHTPSEHRINNEHYPMEIHFVFRTDTTPPKSAVLSFLVELSNGAGDPLFQVIEPYLSQLGEIDSEAEIPALDYSGLRNAFVQSTIYTYAGSLTTPPCSEGVSWFVVGTPLEISVNQYLAYKKILKFNSRISQSDVRNGARESGNLLIDVGCQLQFA